MTANDGETTSGRTQRSEPVKLAIFWAFVGIPLAWGVIETLIKASQLF